MSTLVPREDSVSGGRGHEGRNGSPLRTDNGGPWVEDYGLIGTDGVPIPVRTVSVSTSERSRVRMGRRSEVPP